MKSNIDCFNLGLSIDLVLRTFAVQHIAIVTTTILIFLGRFFASNEAFLVDNPSFIFTFF